MVPTPIRPPPAPVIPISCYSISSRIDFPKMPRFPVRIEVKMKDGHTYTKTYWPLKASPENPVSDEELIAKYRSCAEWYGLPREKTEKSIELLMAIDRLKDPGDVMKLMYHKGRKTKEDAK